MSSPSTADAIGIFTRSSLMAEEPWSGRALRRSLTTGLLGTCAVAVGWVLVESTRDWDKQVLCVVLASLGGMVVAVACTQWLLAGTRAVRVRTADVSRFLALQLSDRGERGGPETPAHSLVVTGPGMTRFHRPTCRMAAGRHVTAVDAVRLRADGLTACGVCRP